MQLYVHVSTSTSCVSMKCLCGCVSLWLCVSVCVALCLPICCCSRVCACVGWAWMAGGGGSLVGIWWLGRARVVPTDAAGGVGQVRLKHTNTHIHTVYEMKCMALLTASNRQITYYAIWCPTVPWQVLTLLSSIIHLQYVHVRY